jgi:hypothetical protein
LLMVIYPDHELKEEQGYSNGPDDTMSVGIIVDLQYEGILAFVSLIQSGVI